MNVYVNLTGREKKKDIYAEPISTPAAIKTAFASSERNCPGELLESLLPREKLCKDEKSRLK